MHTLIVILLHVVQPELDPLRRFMSEFAAGRLGWLMNVAFLALAAGLGALAIAFGAVVAPPLRTTIGAIGLGGMALSAFVSGLFNADLEGAPVSPHGEIHDVAGFLGLPFLLLALFAVTRRCAVRSDALTPAADPGVAINA